MNNNENFIGQSDPTKILDLNNISLEEQYTKLTDEEKLMVGAKMLGMNHIPVDIKTFLFDEYFLGTDNITNHGNSIFKFWLDKLDMIFPTPITTKYPWISCGGATGIGKSTAVKMSGLYHFHRLDCCQNVFKSVGLAGGTRLAFGFFHASEQTARKDFVQYYKFVFEESPYFRSLYNQTDKKVRLISSGPKSTGAVLGTQLIFCVLSELGFWKPQDGMEKASEVITRYSGRFANKRFTFGGCIADSSAKDEDNRAVRKFEESVEPSELLRIAESQWVVRPELYEESNGKTFDFYRGDAIRGPFVIEDPEQITRDNLDVDRIIQVPISAKLKFLSDPVRNLRDLAGISYSGDENFFNGDLSHLIKCSKIKNYIPEIITVDFYDKTDSIYSKVSQMIYRIPKKTNIFVHYDIGLKSDICGVAICYYDGELKIGNASLPKFKFPLIFGVSRLKGQSTSLDHLYQFLKDLIKNGYQVTFSADSFASAGLFQSCERDNIDYTAISVDKTMDAYYMFKNVVNTERAELVYHNVLLRECSELKLTKNGKTGNHEKIDHPEISSCPEFDHTGKNGPWPGSKDIADACAGSLWSCYQKYAEYKENGGGGYNKQMQALNSITSDPREESQKIFQEMFESIF